MRYCFGHNGRLFLYLHLSVCLLTPSHTHTQIHARERTHTDSFLSSDATTLSCFSFSSFILSLVPVFPEPELLPFISALYSRRHFSSGAALFLPCPSPLFSPLCQTRPGKAQTAGASLGHYKVTTLSLQGDTDGSKSLTQTQTHPGHPPSHPSCLSSPFTPFETSSTHSRPEP